MASKCCDVGFKNPNSVKLLADGNLEFALNLYQSYIQHANGGNAIFSPFSILVALGMTSVGARNNTRDELRKSLKLNVFDEDLHAHQAISDVLVSIGLGGSSKKFPFILSTANRLYMQEAFPVQPDFQKVVTDNYGTDTKTVDFASNADATRTEINKWVEEVTQQKIKDLIPEGILNSLTRLVLVNAIYFKGTWQKRFSPQATFPRPFRKTKTETVKVPMMQLKETFPYAEHDGCQILELPYNGDRLGMFLVLPSEEHALSDFERKLSPEFLNSLMQPMTSIKVKVILPKFKLDVGVQLNNILNDLGIKELFSDTKADLSGISPGQGLFVSAVLHKAFIDVNEEGTEAAAATAAAMNLRSISFDPNFIADRPFLFFIYDKAAEMILFMGRLTDPPTTASHEGKTEL